MGADAGQAHLAMALVTLPKPSLTFTVPSLHDGLPLDCRIYHPHALAASPDAPPWQKHAAIVAHPYAPLGGCYDDPIVDLVASTLLRLGFLVATFNFRGAHGSAGKTSWTAKAERADYMSAVGFVSHYVHFLDPFRPPPMSTPTSASHGRRLGDDEEATSTIRIRPPTPGLPELSGAATPILLLGGYSYGAMITSQLPCFETIAALFDAPKCGAPAAEIRLRAQHLAEMQNTVLASAREAAVDHLRPTSPRKYVGLRVGGDEEGRKSRESWRPRSAEFEETIRQGVAELMARTRKGHRRSHSGSRHATPGPEGGPEHAPEPAPTHLLPILGRTTYHPAYLLVSPLEGIITNLATMSLPPLLSVPGKVWTRLSPKANEAASSDTPKPPAHAHSAQGEAEKKLVQNATLAIYGDRDGFVPVRKLRDWASRLEAVPDSKFRAHEVSSANHFWAQGNVASTLREAVRAFATSLLDGGAT